MKVLVYQPRFGGMGGTRGGGTSGRCMDARLGDEICKNMWGWLVDRGVGVIGD